MNDGRLSRKLKSPRSLIFLLLTFCLLFISFGWNIFHIENEQLTVNLGVDDSYIISTLLFYANGPELLRDFGEMQIDEGGILIPYEMQVGLQRLFYSWLSPPNKAGVVRAIPYLRRMIEAALALTLTGFVAAVLSEFGYLCAGITAVLFALSNWLIIFAPDLFWICATFFIPFVLAWLLGDPTRPKKQQRLLAVLYLVFCTIKCLCGFDYITNIFAAVAVPFLYYGLREGDSLRKISMRVVRYGLLSIAAFCIAVVLQLMQYAFVQKDLRRSLQYFSKEAGRRTLSNGEGLSSGYDAAVLLIFHKLHFPQAHDAVIQHYLPHLRPILRYVRYLGMGAATIPLPIHSLKLPIGLLIVGFLAVFWKRRRQLLVSVSSGTPDRTAAWVWATLAALFISHIWVVAANGHMTHTFFNAIVFYIPFLPMVYVLIAIGLSSLIHRSVDLRRRKADLVV